MKVEHYGRLFFMVHSESREHLRHFVDLERNVYGKRPFCTCEAYQFDVSRPCKHILGAIEFCFNEMRYPKAASMTMLAIKEGIIKQAKMGKPIDVMIHEVLAAIKKAEENTTSFKTKCKPKKGKKHD